MANLHEESAVSFLPCRTWVITGGAGFIGSHLAKALVARGQRVRIVDDFSSGSAENLRPVAGQVECVRADIRNFAALGPAFAGADYVLHHAALVSVPLSVQKPSETYQINVQGTSNVLEAARRAGVKRVVFAGSSAVYGNGTDLPYKESSARNFKSPYALSKQIGEDLCRLYARSYGLETVTLIYFNVFGPGQSAKSPYAAVIAKFLEWAAQGRPLGIDWNGRQSRDFVHVQDVVQANLLAALSARSGESYNVASGKACSLLELADLLDRISGQKLPRVFRPKRPGDVKLSAADISKIRALGFEPKVSLQDALAEMWAQLKNQAE